VGDAYPGDDWAAMFARGFGVFARTAALLCAHCGYVGLELLPLDAGDTNRPDAGAAPDAEVQDARSQDARAPDDAAPELDASAEDASAEDASAEDASADAASAEDASAALDGQVADAARADAQVADASSADASLADAALPCDLAGNWGAKLTVSTSWPASGVVLAGSGTSTLWLRYQTNASGAIVPGSSAACGLLLPSATTPPALGSQTYQPLFANALFDAVPARVVGTAGALTVGGSGFPGSPVTLAPTAFLLGATLMDPVNDPWPAASALVSADQDLDLAPAITVGFPSGSLVPIGANMYVDQAYLAVRLAFGATLTLNSCDLLSGSAVVTHFDSHVLGCHILNGGSCMDAQRNAFDAARPIYTPGSATLTVRTLANATCAVVRSTLP
jgi:hypothetical protein